MYQMLPVQQYVELEKMLSRHSQSVVIHESLGIHRNLAGLLKERGRDAVAWAVLFTSSLTSGLAMGMFEAWGYMDPSHMKKLLQDPAALWLKELTRTNNLPARPVVMTQWDQAQIYCCISVCPTYLSAIGNALGYASYIRDHNGNHMHEHVCSDLSHRGE
jgi:hypothetical protein